jgi:hypothetical protein
MAVLGAMKQLPANNFIAADAFKVKKKKTLVKTGKTRGVKRARESDMYSEMASALGL